MTWMEFLASVIDSVVWPICVLLIVNSIKGNIPDLIRSLSRFKYKDIEVEFEKTSMRIAETAKKTLPSVDGNVFISGQSEEAHLERLNTISEISPRSSILEAWLLVESAALDAVQKAGVSSFKSHPGPMRLRDYLLKADLLTKEQQLIFEQLRQLRNDAVHSVDAEFSNAAVNYYVESALQLAIYLEERANEL